VESHAGFLPAFYFAETAALQALFFTRLKKAIVGGFEVIFLAYLLFFSAFLVPDAHAATFIVTSTSDLYDELPGDGVCADAQDFCNLRGTINEINILGEPDNAIYFDIPYGDPGHNCYLDDGISGQVSLANVAQGSPDRADECAYGTIDPDYPYTWFRINKSHEYPETYDRFISYPVVIDGYSQEGALEATASRPAILKIELNGELQICNGFNIEGGNSTIKGLVINQTQSGLVLENNGGNVISGNYIGTDISGTVIMGNTHFGIENIEDSGDEESDGSSNNLIGGTTPAARNVISGNGSFGVLIMDASSTGNVVAGNYIGTDSTGAMAMPNGHGGVLIHSGASGNTIGGTTPGARNVISGNRMSGIDLMDASTAGNVIAGNSLEPTPAALSGLAMKAWA